VKQATYIGKPVRRLEDRALLTGAGRFAADLHFPVMLEAAFVRSPHAHARIRKIDTRAARSHPDVHAVLTLADLAPLLSRERLPLGFRTDELPPGITFFVFALDVVVFV
jgi:aerobic carbon-monoxide dehydrogenase large subunit